MTDKGKKGTPEKPAAGGRAALPERCAPVDALARLALLAGLNVDRLAIERAVREAFGADRPASDSAYVDRLLAAADRLGIRIRIHTLPLSQALDLATRQTPLAIGVAGSSSNATWLVVQQQAAGRLAGVGPAGERISLSRPEALQLFGGQSTLPVLVATVAGDEEGVAADVHSGDAHAASHGQPHQSPLGRLIAMLRPEFADMAYVALFSAIVGLLALATPVAVESLVNTVAFGRLLQPIFVLCLLLLTFLLFAAAMRVLQAYVAELIQQRIMVRVVADLAYRLPRVQYQALAEKHGPELLNRFFDVITVQKSAALLVLEGIAMVMQTVIGMVVLAWYHPYLLGFNLFLIVCVAFIVFVLGYGAVRTAIDESIAKYAVAAWLEELAHYPVTFKSDGGPRRAVDLADRLTADYLRARRRHFRILLRQVVFTVGLQAAGSALLLGLGGWLVVNGQLTLGQLVAAELIVAVILGSFAKLGKHMESFYDLLAAVDKLGHLFDLEMERATGSTLDAGTGPASLRLHRVSCDFDNGRTAVSDVSCDITRGEMVALFGGAGSGKSVLLDLVYALREPAAGWVEIDGMDVRSLQMSTLRQQVVLLRHREVFTGTVAENVHLDRAEVDLAAVRDALAAVGLLDEILDLPAGLETPLLMGGSPLSETQARRLVLARALAGRPRLVLIDGLLDMLSDDRWPVILDALRRRRTHTTVVIATGHRDIAAACDRQWRLPSNRAQEPELPTTGTAPNRLAGET